jgi:hypothetical protein
MKPLRLVYSSLLVMCFAMILWPLQGYALEKYGRPLPPMTAREKGQAPEETLVVSGYLLTAAFPYNPSFFARPDNTGLVGMRHMLHLETDLYKQYLTFYTDQNFFSDRTNGWIELSEWDGTYALTGAVDRFNWRMQYERDAGIDRRTIVQDYADGLVTAKMQSAQDIAGWSHLFPNQNLTAYAGVGWLFRNQNYYARPDNTGRALFRYVAHADLDLYKNKVVLYGDVNMFTDREAENKASPTELDWIVGLAFRWRRSELAVYYEQDQPLDREGLIQKYFAVQLRYSFDFMRRDMKIGKTTSPTLVH